MLECVLRQHDVLKVSELRVRVKPALIRAGVNLMLVHLRMQCRDHQVVSQSTVTAVTVAAMYRVAATDTPSRVTVTACIIAGGVQGCATLSGQS